MPSLNTKLPTSRINAAITISSHLAAAFFGKAPKRGHLKSIISTFISTSFAIVGALVTIHDSYVDGADFTIYKQKATISIILMSIISSILSLYSIFCSLTKSDYQSFKVAKCGCVATIIIGCYCLYQIYKNSYHTEQNDNDNLAGIVVVVFAAVAIIGALFIWKCTLRDKSLACCCNLFGGDEESSNENRRERYIEAPLTNRAAVSNNQMASTYIEAASINRAVAFFKACLFCAYWCLADIAILNFIKSALLGMKNVNNDYDQDYNNDLQYWEYGQWLKHGIAVINNILNEC